MCVHGAEDISGTVWAIPFSYNYIPYLEWWRDFIEKIFDSNWKKGLENYWQNKENMWEPLDFLASLF